MSEYAIKRILPAITELASASFRVFNIKHIRIHPKFAGEFRDLAQSLAQYYVQPHEGNESIYGIPVIWDNTVAVDDIFEISLSYQPLRGR